MTSSPIPPTASEAYVDLVATVRDLAYALLPALDARFEAPPGSVLGARDGLPPDPTGETVLDVRRWELSAAVTAAASAMQRATNDLRQHTAALDSRLAAWNGDDGGTTE